MNKSTMGVEIKVLDTEETYHALNDWGLAIGNTDYIGDPVQETYYIDIPGRDGQLDGSEAISGRRVFKSRPILMQMGGKANRNEWDVMISDIRNKIHGRQVQVIFDNDTSHYWQGRIYVENFTRTRELAEFELSIPNADPYKYNITDSTEEWLWDPLDFEDGVIDEGNTFNISGTSYYTLYADAMPYVPNIIVNTIGSAGIKVLYDGECYSLTAGGNRIPEMVVAKEDVVLQFSGSGNVTMQFRKGSL